MATMPTEQHRIVPMVATFLASDYQGGDPLSARNKMDPIYSIADSHNHHRRLVEKN